MFYELFLIAVAKYRNLEMLKYLMSVVTRDDLWKYLWEGNEEQLEYNKQSRIDEIMIYGFVE